MKHLSRSARAPAPVNSRIRELVEESDFYRNRMIRFESEAALIQEWQGKYTVEQLKKELHQIHTKARLELTRVIHGLEASVPNEDLKAIQDLFEESFSRSGKMMLKFSPGQLFDGGLPAIVEWFTNQIKLQAGIPVEVMNGGIPKLPDTRVQVFLCRIIRQILSNILKFAGARRVRIVLCGDSRYLKIDVEDDGAGLDTAQTYNCSTNCIQENRRESSYYAVRESIRSWGGYFHIQSEPVGGTKSTIFMPV